MIRREAVIQARMSSRRCPGKMLADVRGRPLLDYVIDRVGAARGLDGVVVATSTHPTDDALARHCDSRGVACERGPLDDVAGRFALVICKRALTAFVRVNGDSPFLDPQLIEQGLRLFDSEPADLVTNVFPRSYPKGQSVEIVDGQAFRRACQQMETPAHREHVTRVFYDNPADFRILSFRADADYSQKSLCIDTPADLDRARRRLKSLPDFPRTGSWKEILTAFQSDEEEAR